MLPQSTNISNISNIGAGDGALDPAAVALFAAMNVQPSSARKALINNAISSLKSFGVWSTKDLIYATAAHDSQAGLLNWKNPGTNTITAVNSPTFTTDRGYTSDGSTSYLNTGIAPSALTQFTQNSANVNVWSLTQQAANATAVELGSAGAGGTVNGLTLSFRFTGDVLPYRINDTTAINAANTNTAAMATIQRTAAGATSAYINGSSIGTSSQASTGLSVQPIFICNNNNNGLPGGNWSTKQIALVTVGSSLSDANVANEYSVWQTFLHALGAV